MKSAREEYRMNVMILTHDPDYTLTPAEMSEKEIASPKNIVVNSNVQGIALGAALLNRQDNIPSRVVILIPDGGLVSEKIGAQYAEMRDTTIRSSGVRFGKVSDFLRSQKIVEDETLDVDEIVINARFTLNRQVKATPLSAPFIPGRPRNPNPILILNNKFDQDASAINLSELKAAVEGNQESVDTSSSAAQRVSGQDSNKVKVFLGTNVPVRDLFNHLANGDTIEGFLKSYPTVDRGQASRVLEDAVALLESHN